MSHCFISPERRWKLLSKDLRISNPSCPIAGTFDLYESGTHHGLMSSGFITPFLFMIGMTSGTPTSSGQQIDGCHARSSADPRHPQEVRERKRGSRDRWSQGLAQPAPRPPIPGTISGLLSLLSIRSVTLGGTTEIWFLSLIASSCQFYLACDWQNVPTTAKTVALICGPRLSSPAPGG
jgi:hypothetical protein